MVKPIYPEDLDNNSLLTSNQRTSESCGAMQAGHTVSAIEDNILNISESISSSPSEILSSNINNNLVLTYPDDELLPDETDTTSTDSNTTPLVEETSTNLYSDSSEIHDPLACYNKFLYHHRFQTLPAPQTVGSFLEYIQENYPMYYSNQYIRISIKPHPRISYYFMEAHIYLPYEDFIPGHFFSPFDDLLVFYKLELKSSTSSNLHFSNNNNIQIPNSIDDFFYPTLSPTLLPHTNLPIANNNLIIPSNSQSTHDLHINIATHNVRGFNLASKRQIWQDYCINYNISIACITETKISHKTKLSFCNNNLYTYYWANADSSIEGAAIMIRNYLKPYVHSSYTHPGGAVALDLFFKSNIKLRIISVYLSSTDTIKRNNTQNTVINWILQARQLNLHPIILGDFNTQDNNISSSSSKYKLINFLHHINMFDIGAHFNNTHYT